MTYINGIKNTKTIVFNVLYLFLLSTLQYFNKFGKKQDVIPQVMTFKIMLYCVFSLLCCCVVDSIKAFLNRNLSRFHSNEKTGITPSWLTFLLKLMQILSPICQTCIFIPHVKYLSPRIFFYGF